MSPTFESRARRVRKALGRALTKCQAEVARQHGRILVLHERIQV